MGSNQSSKIEVINIKFNSLEEYVRWAVKKLQDEIDGLSHARVVHGSTERGLVTYQFRSSSGNLVTLVNIDFEMEHVDWYTGNKQEDPDWVYSPQKEEYQIWGGVQRLAQKLQQHSVTE